MDLVILGVSTGIIFLIVCVVLCFGLGLCKGVG